MNEIYFKYLYFRGTKNIFYQMFFTFWHHLSRKSLISGIMNQKKFDTFSFYQHV